MTYFIYNGKTYQEGTPVIGADNRGLRYGDGVFETIRMKQGKLIFEDEHFARLWKGLNNLEFIIPRHFTPENLVKEMSTVCQKNGHLNSARVRLQVFRGDGGLYDAKTHSPSYIIQSWPLTPTNDDWNTNGLVLGFYRPISKPPDMLSNLKHNNFLIYVLAALHGKKQKWNDAILFNTNGQICETTIANLFLVKNEKIYTPPLTDGCVAGVMRKMLVNHLAQSKQSIQESSITEKQLMNADEVFLTNSIFNIRWVQRISDTSYNNTFTRKIFDAFRPTFS